MNAFRQAMRRSFSAHPGWLALAASVVLAVVGINAIATVSEGFAARQTMWLVVGLVALAICLVPRPRLLQDLSYPLFAFSICLLVFVILPFVPRWLVPVRNGATAWINLGVMAFQPSELTKIAFVMAMAEYLRHRESYRTVRGLLTPFILLLVPVFLILKEPDLGTALLFPPALLVMLVAAGAKLRHMLALVGLGLVAVVVNVAIIYVMPDSLQVLKPHQRNRVKAMISQVQGDTQYIEGIGYQQHKAMTLVRSGGLTGYGDRAATIVRHNRLPHDHNDMIFAVVVNRWGLLGGLTVLGLYVVLFGSMLLVAAGTRDPFARLVTVGFTGLLATQAAINIAITLGLLPVTGITLPLISYGGSSLAATFAMIGLVINFATRPAAMLSWPSFEFAGR